MLHAMLVALSIAGIVMLFAGLMVFIFGAVLLIHIWQHGIY